MLKFGTPTIALPLAKNVLFKLDALYIYIYIYLFIAYYTFRNKLYSIGNVLKFNRKWTRVIFRRIA